MMFDSFEAYDVQATRRESKAEGKAEAVLIVLEELGALPEELQEKVKATRSAKKLNAWLKLAARAESLEAFCEQAGLDLKVKQ